METVQLESRAVEEAKEEEAAMNELIIEQQAKYADVLKLQEIMTCGKLYPINVAITKRTMQLTWWITARSVAHHAEQVGRPEDGSSREKAEAPAEVAAGAASVEVAADAESHKKASAEVAGAVSVEVSTDEKTFLAP